jgi:hypothetical protein
MSRPALIERQVYQAGLLVEEFIVPRLLPREARQAFRVLLGRPPLHVPAQNGTRHQRTPALVPR